MAHKIILYQFESCPYCRKVRDKLDELGWKYEKVNVSRDRSSKERRDLFKKSGVKTVPVIKIDGDYTGESDDIVDELEKLSGKKDTKRKKNWFSKLMDKI